MDFNNLVTVCIALCAAVLIAVVGGNLALDNTHEAQKMKACVASGQQWKVSTETYQKMECVK